MPSIAGLFQCPCKNRNILDEKWLISPTVQPLVQYIDWGMMDYKLAWDQQSELHQSLISAKRSGNQLHEQGYLILCEHPAVYTLGKSGSEANLLLDAASRKASGLEFYKINRGGDITHHGPGQIVGYPILDLEYWYRDVHRYVREMEEVIIRSLKIFDIESFRLQGFTGVWTQHEGVEKKVCAIGVHLSRWVSMHGFALNVNNDLSLFNHIIPCGIEEEGKEVTSMSTLLGIEINLSEVKETIKNQFGEIFNCKISEIEWESEKRKQ